MHSTLNGGERRTDTLTAHATGRLARAAAAAVFDRLEPRQLMAAHVAGSTVSYATIQAAVNAAAAGGTVTVDAGTYTGTVTVAKPLTLRGVQAGVDARSNARTAAANETVVTGAAVTSGSTTSVGASFYVTANDVTLDGLVVQGETNQDLMLGAGIVIGPGVSGTHVVNDVVQNNVAGLFLANASGTDAAVIQHDVFRNNNNAGVNGGRGIYTDEAISGGTLTDVTIDGNAFVGNRGSNGTTGLEAAVAFESGTNAQSQTNLTLTNNAFDGNGKAILCFNVTGLTFANNVVTRGLDWYSGIVRFEGNDHNVTITGNNLFANTGPAVAVDTKGVPGDDSGFVVTGNNIYGNGTTSGKAMGVVFNGDVYDGTFDARNNYWGTATGPSGDGSGTGDGVYGQGHVVSGQSWSVTAGGGGELFAPYATAPLVTQDTPYWGLASTDGAKIQAEDFDHGGEGIGYHDTTAGNTGGAYRTTGVDIESTSDAGGGYDVGWTAAGEWLDYAVNLTNGGTYQTDVRLACAYAGATFNVLVDGTQVGATTAVPNTGSYQSWQTVSLAGLSLTAGSHVVRVQFVANSTGGAGPNFNWFQLTNTAVVPTPAPPVGLTATANGPGEVDLTWTNAASNASGVKVQRSVDGTNYSTVATLAATATAYVDAGRSPVTTYTYRIVATNAGGDSAPSATASATTAPAAATPLSALAWTSATAGWSTPQVNATIKGRTITLRGATYASGIGTHASSTISYALAGRFGTFTTAVGVDDETAGNGAVDFQVFGDGNLLADSGVLTGTAAAKTFTLNVTGVNTLTLVANPGVAGSIDYDHADWAGATLLTSAPTPATPTAPTGLAATTGSASTVYLSWTNPATNATAFAVDRSADGGTTWTTVATPTGTAYADAGLTGGTTYTYRVRATNAVGASTPSATAAATTLATAATVIGLTTLVPTSATVGYGTLQTNATIKGNPLVLRGTTYATGLGAHASSTVSYALGGGYATFLSDVGVDDEVNGQGAIDFQVYGDGTLLGDSGVLTGTSPVAHLAVNVAGVQTLTLVASPGVAGTIDYDHADWAGTRLVAAAATTPTPTTTGAAMVRAALLARTAQSAAATASVTAQVSATASAGASSKARAAVTKREVARAKAAAARAAKLAVRARAKAAAAARVLDVADARLAKLVLALGKGGGSTPAA